MHRNSYRYQYKLITPPGSSNNLNPPPPPPSSATPMVGSTQNGKSIRTVLSAQSVIRIKEPYYSNQINNKISNNNKNGANPKNNMLNNNNSVRQNVGLIRASTYNSANSGLNPLAATTAGTPVGSVSRTVNGAGARYLPSFGSHPRLYTPSSQSKNLPNIVNSSSGRRISRNFDKITTVADFCGNLNNNNNSNRCSWQVIDSIEQMLIKSKNPLSNDELKKFAYKQNGFESTRCKCFFFKL